MPLHQAPLMGPVIHPDSSGALCIEAIASDAPRAVEPPLFAQVYAAHFDFVWRSLRRLGVAESSLDDAVQDVFVVVHCRLAEFEGRAQVKTWLFSILRKVARNHRPKARRTEPVAPEELADAHTASPLESAERAEGARLLHRLLDELDDDKREAFVLSDVEQMTVPEIAEALGVNLNTVYSRVRAARREMEQALARVRANETWRAR